VKLAGVSIETDDLDHAAAVFAAICGVAPDQEADRVRFSVGDASLRVSRVVNGGGLVAIALDDPDGRLAEAPVSLNGIRIETAPPARPRQAEAHLDHVAVLVRDLAAASEAWSALTGAAPEMLGVHPVSGGTFLAARLHLGDRMIELVQPVEGVESALADRLARHGEGAATLALPVNDVRAARDRLEAIDARVLFREPHWFVHPRDTGGVLVQLTPRVEH
jgi:catechol 2,3-dioxygenase-like lactoylglutathione lyase family enzyme